MDFRTSNLSYIILTSAIIRDTYPQQKTSHNNSVVTTRVDDGSRKSGDPRHNPVDMGIPYPMIFVRVSSVFGGWPWIMTWSSWDCAMGCDAKSSGPRGMEKAKKIRFAEFWDPRFFWQPKHLDTKNWLFLGHFIPKKQFTHQKKTVKTWCYLT